MKARRMRLGTKTLSPAEAASSSLLVYGAALPQSLLIYFPGSLSMVHHVISDGFQGGVGTFQWYSPIRQMESALQKSLYALSVSDVHGQTPQGSSALRASPALDPWRC